jgi:hypothetical protein
MLSFHAGKERKEEGIEKKVELNCVFKMKILHCCLNKKAHQRRIFADSLIRYYFYVENMPPNEADELTVDLVKRLESKAKISKALSDTDSTSLIIEVNKEYSKTMN